MCWSLSLYVGLCVVLTVCGYGASEAPEESFFFLPGSRLELMRLVTLMSLGPQSDRGHSKTWENECDHMCFSLVHACTV